MKAQKNREEEFIINEVKRLEKKYKTTFVLSIEQGFYQIHIDLTKQEKERNKTLCFELHEIGVKCWEELNIEVHFYLIDNKEFSIGKILYITGEINEEPNLDNIQRFIFIILRLFEKLQCKISTQKDFTIKNLYWNKEKFNMRETWDRIPKALQDLIGVYDNTVLELNNLEEEDRKQFEIYVYLLKGEKVLMNEDN